MVTPHRACMTHDQIHHTLLTACRFGGSFYRQLATAALIADPSNRQRIFEAFPELIQQYGPTTSFYLKS